MLGKLPPLRDRQTSKTEVLKQAMLLLLSNWNRHQENNEQAMLDQIISTLSGGANNNLRHTIQESLKHCIRVLPFPYNIAMFDRNFFKLDGCLCL